MYIPIKIPKFIITSTKCLLLNWFILFTARILMLTLLWKDISGLPKKDILYALYIGSKFDMRIAVFMSLPLCTLLAIPHIDNTIQKIKTWVILFYSFIFSTILFLYITDFGYFFYTRHRIDATLFDFFKDPLTSTNMVIESYPLYLLIPIALVILTFYLKSIQTILYNHQQHTSYIKPTPRIIWTLLAILTLFIFGYGQIQSNLFPLRWSNAYFSVNSDLVTLALNPIQNLFDTYRMTFNTPPDIKATRNSYQRMAQWLHVPQPNKETLSFLRMHESSIKEKDVPINIVIIIMESLTWPRTSLAPGKDNPTPNLKMLAKDALVFPLFFAPSRTTARAIFTTMTGIPDVNRGGGTSSRNQKLIHQHLIMNDFKNYEKYYLIGGSASWANIRGLLKHNIEDLQLIEEGYWKAPNINVWGISDLALFQESIELFNKTHQPFIAVIQTTSFHRPYTIPKDNANYIPVEPSTETLKNYGYTDSREYNAMHFADHALGVFFLLAKTQPWFKNTVFAILGDHGLSDPSKNMTPGYLACKLQDSHIPLLLYAPGRINPGIYPYPCGQPDLFPTLASLAGISYRNQTLGRDLFNPIHQTNTKQFITGSTEAFIRLIQDNYCYIKEGSEGLYDLNSKELINLLETDTKRAQNMREAATDFFNTAKYMLYNNK